MTRRKRIMADLLRVIPPPPNRTGLQRNGPIANETVTQESEGATIFLAMLIHEDLTRRIIHSFYETYNELGYGFLESVYERALAIALEDTGISVERQRPLSVHFRGHLIGAFRADLVVGDAVLLELKAARALDSSHKAQLINALKATDLEVGLLLNFGPRAEFKRVVYSNNTPTHNKKTGVFGHGICDDLPNPRDPRLTKRPLPFADAASSEGPPDA